MTKYFKTTIIKNPDTGEIVGNYDYSKNNATRMHFNNNNVYMAFENVTEPYIENHFEEITEEEFYAVARRPEEDTPEKLTPAPQPTNAEIAQSISDLQADLIIAGVI